MARVLLAVLAVFLLVTLCEMRKTKVKDYPSKKQLVLQRKETTAVDFTRLVVMRLVYGFAKVLGFKEPISEALNGAFVPPGVDEDDDDDDEDSLFDDY